MKRISASYVLSALALITVLMHFVVAGESPATTGGVQKTQLVPGTKCVVTAQLECEISEVDQDSIHVTISAIQKTMHGTPILKKVPYPNRLFKSTGVSDTKMEVVLQLSKDQITAIKPVQTVETTK
jgi:hypothetical protein